MRMLKTLWRDDAGVTYTIEVILVATIACIGLVVGLTTLRDSVTNELADVAGAVDSLVQTYQINGIVGHSASVNGSLFVDQLDYCDSVGDDIGEADQCVLIGVPPTGNTEGQGPTPPSGRTN